MTKVGKRTDRDSSTTGAISTHCKTKNGIEFRLRPVKTSDIFLLQNFFSLLSNDSLYSRYHSAIKLMSLEQLEKFVTIDHAKEMIILSIVNNSGKEEVVGMGEYRITGNSLMADIALTVRDDFQNLGIGKELFGYLVQTARDAGILGFSAEVLADNTSVSRMSERMGIKYEKEISQGISKLSMLFASLMS